MIEIYEAGYEIAQTRWHGMPGDCVAITFPRSSIERVLHGEGRGIEIVTCHEVLNSQIAHLGYTLANEYRNGMPNGALFSEGMSIALLGLVIRSHSSRRQDCLPNVCLSTSQKQRISDFIETNLGSHITVEHMATMLDMSSYQFSHRFKSSYGMSPHQFIMHKRLTAAIRELRKDLSRPIAEIALELGFSNQAHLTSVFRKHLGTTPARSRWS